MRRAWLVVSLAVAGSTAGCGAETLAELARAGTGVARSLHGEASDLKAAAEENPETKQIVCAIATNTTVDGDGTAHLPGVEKVVEDLPDTPRSRAESVATTMQDLASGQIAKIGVDLGCF
jgi:hypothetical protein